MPRQPILDGVLSGSAVSTALFFDRTTSNKRRFWTRIFPSSEGITGPYWGIRLGEVKAGAWKIDLWALEPEIWKRQIDAVEELNSSLTAEQRQNILELKSQLWDHPEYRKSISSFDVYQAVRIGGARSLAEFWSFVREHH